MLRKILKSALIGAGVAVIFCAGHWLGMEYQASLPESCTIPEAKTVTFLESELSKCFTESNLESKRVNKCVELLEDCMGNPDRALCEDRNLWFTRAHQIARIPLPEDQLWDCGP
jgi:hypothetical protein